MRKVFTESGNIVSPLGITTDDNANQLLNNHTGVKQINDPSLFPTSFWASKIDDNLFDIIIKNIPDNNTFTRFESLLIASISQALSQSEIDITSKKTIIILASTKGNIDMLDPSRYPGIPNDRLYLWKTAEVIQKFYGNPNTPIVISFACISGILALITGMRMIQDGIYDNAVVTGGDILTGFVVSGFQSFKSLATSVCKPYDASRDGLNIGEGCATLVLTSQKNKNTIAHIAGGSSTNDANHISGPSRNGEGLFLAIEQTMKEAQIEAKSIDYISAHGTATLYNDEMEAIALSRAGLTDVPVNSFKGYYGHTLGGSGLIESVLTLYSMQHNILFKTMGFEKPGVSHPINVVKEHTNASLNHCLKTGSGFGGSNAAILFSSENGK
jgi:3-oxoacyl-[acyl-carrier-protein] synthase I